MNFFGETANYISSVESHKGTITIKRCSVENQKGAVVIYIDSTLLVLNGASYNIDSALLALNWRFVDFVIVIKRKYGAVWNNPTKRWNVFTLLIHR